MNDLRPKASPVCQVCGGNMKKSSDGRGMLMGCLGAIILVTIGVLLFLIPVIGWILGAIIIVGALFRSLSTKKGFWVCKSCGAKFERQLDSGPVILLCLLALIFFAVIALFRPVDVTEKTSPRIDQIASGESQPPVQEKTHSPTKAQPTPRPDREGFLYLKAPLKIKDESGIRNYRQGSEIRVKKVEEGFVTGTIDGQEVTVPEGQTESR